MPRQAGHEQVGTRDFPPDPADLRHQLGDGVLAGDIIFEER